MFCKTGDSNSTTEHDTQFNYLRRNVSYETGVKKHVGLYVQHQKDIVVHVFLSLSMYS